MVCGFTFDLIIAKRPDSLFDNVLLLFYLTVSATCIVFLNRQAQRKKLENQAAFDGKNSAEPLFLLLVMQFCFGGLASNLLILYGKSGSLGSSLLFIALLAGLLVGNEFLKNKYEQLRFNLAIYYIELLTYLVIAVPTFVTHAIGTGTFILSGILSLVIMVVVLGLLFPSIWNGKLTRPVFGLGSMVLVIFAIFNVLYFANIIPPVPLSLKSAGIYHSVSSLDAPNGSGAIYSATYEPKQWYEFWRDTADTFNVGEGQPAYCFSAVFAPGDLSTSIVHRWEYFYPQTKHWITTGVVKFPINGGRAEGYRGYSKKQVLAEGQWRCTVETASGQVISRITFTVKTSSSTPALTAGTL